ncbi:MAG: hypothetical protein OQK04_19205, partial [Kangiellaceae bacterium]|nr:hypothetical protein [Kangiellaceae bacterium]
RTAKQIAAVESPKESPLNTLQRILFLPFSIIGTLLTVIGSHFRNRRHGYWLIAKNLIALGLLFFTILFSVLVYEFNQSRVFSTFSAWLLSACAIYIVVLILAVYWKEFYLAKPRTKVDKKLKQGALIPAAVFVFAITFTNLAHKEHESEYIEKEFSLKSGLLNLKFDEKRIEEQYAETVAYQVVNRNNASEKLVLKIEYSASGKTLDEVKYNIEMINYEFDFDGETLELDKYWTLEDDAINRSQNVNVIIEVPQDVMVRSNRQLDVRRGKQEYFYTASHYYRESSRQFNYISANGFVHEVGEGTLDKLSENERQVLNNKFCEEFFISDLWNCSYNIRNAVDDNYRFDKAFENDAENINKIREFLLPDRSLFVSNLNEIKQLIQAISIEYSTKSKLQAHIEHLIEVKYHTDFMTVNLKGTDEASR